MSVSNSLRLDWYRNPLHRVILLSDQPVDLLEKVFDSLNLSIEDCYNRIERAKDTEDYDYITAVIDIEQSLIENFIATAFILSQTYITYIYSKVHRLHLSCGKIGIKLITARDDKVSTMLLGDEKINNSQYSRIQFIDACANYFKHHDEWPKGKWEDYSKNYAEKTVEKLCAAGLSQNTLFFFGQAMLKLGANGEGDFTTLANILRNWGKTVFFLYDQELIKQKLIKPY